MSTVTVTSTEAMNKHLVLVRRFVFPSLAVAFGLFLLSQCLVGIVTGLLDGRSGVRSQAGAVLLSCPVQTGNEVLSSSCWVNTRQFIPRTKAAGTWSWLLTSLLPSLRTGGAVPPVTVCAFMILLPATYFTAPYKSKTCWFLLRRCCGNIIANRTLLFTTLFLPVVCVCVFVCVVCVWCGVCGVCVCRFCNVCVFW